MKPWTGSLIAALLLAGCAGTPRPPVASAIAAPTLTDRVRAVLSTPALAGTRWGLLVVDADGRELVSIAPDERFIPASNTKMVTIAAAYAQPGFGTAPVMGTAVALAGPDVVLIGAGDPVLADSADCQRNCLAELADAIAAKTGRVRDVIGDDRLYPDERWGPGWSWNNLQGRSGTATSALTLNDNVVMLRVTADKIVTEDDWFAIDNRLTAGPKTDIGVERLPDSRTVRLYGTIAADAPPQTLTLGIGDPAEWAAYRLARLLRARGVTVAGKVMVRHRAVGDPAPAAMPVLARLTRPPSPMAVRHTMKASQNLYAELLLRRVGAMRGDRGAADGLAAIEAMFAQAGVARSGWDFADGSGMSTYNRLSPRATVGLLRWVQAQPWGAEWRSTLPIGGVDGTLASRFKGTPLAGRVFAKTGSLNATSALSGFMTTASGRTLTFASFANDQPSTAGSATRAIEDALNLIALEN